MCTFSGPNNNSITKGTTPKKTPGRTPKKASFADVLKKGLMKCSVPLSRSQRAHNVLQRARLARAARTTTNKTAVKTKFDMVRIFCANTTRYYHGH